MSPEQPSAAPQQHPDEGNEHEQYIDNVRQQLQELQEAVQSSAEDKEVLVEESAARLAAAMEPLSKMPEDQRTETIKRVVDVVLGKFMEDPQALDVLRGIRESQAELATLKQEVSADDLSDELAALSSEKPEQQPGEGSLVGTAFEWMDSMIEQLADSKQLGEKQREWIERISGTAKEMITAFAERLASIDVPLAGSISVLGEADERLLAERRYKTQREALAADPKLEADFNEETHKPQWVQAYRAWLKQPDGKPMPTLADVVEKSPQTEKAAAAEEQAENEQDAIFGSDELERELSVDETVELTANNGREVRLNGTNITVRLADGPVDVQLKNAAGDTLSVRRVIRENPELTNPAQFMLEAGSGADTFTVEELVQTVEGVKDSDEAAIEDTDLRVRIT